MHALLYSSLAATIAVALLLCGILLCGTVSLLNQERHGGRESVESVEIDTQSEVAIDNYIPEPTSMDNTDFHKNASGRDQLASQESNATKIRYQPMKDIIYSKSGSHNSDRSVFVAPRRAFFDPRLVAGKPLNQVVVLAEIHDDAIKSIVACEINGVLSETATLAMEDPGWVRVNMPGFTHRYALIWCHGLPQDSIVNGSVVRVIYKRTDEDFYSRVEVEMPLYVADHIDNDPLTIDRGKGSVVVCSTVFDHPPLFDQWLKYQKTLNVDMVHLNVEESFYSNATQLYPFLKEALETGFVQMYVWKNIANDRTFYKGQLVKWHDCIYRYIGVFEFAFFIDADDFLVPVLAEHKDVHFYLNKYFADSHWGGLDFNWRQMKCKPVLENIKTVSDGNLTSLLSSTDGYWRNEAKCAYRLNGVKNILVHFAHEYMPGFKKTYAKRSDIYMAHLRDSAEICK